MGKRIALWDNLKFILITCVVIGHFADQYTDVSNSYASIFLFIYSFHMPLFIFIFGLLYKPKNIRSKFTYFVIIGFLYKIISTLIDRLLGNINVEFSLLSDGGISWFMFAMGVYVVIGYLIENQNINFIFLFSILLACFVGYDQTVGDYLYISRIIIFFPFFLLGMIFQKIDIEKLKYNKVFFLGAIIILATWLSLCFFELDFLYRFRYLFTGRNAFFPQILEYAPLYRLIASFISLIMCMSLIIIVPNINIKGITKWGANSINVYFWHMNIFYISDRFFHITSIYNYGLFGKIVYLLVAIIFSVLLSQNIFKFPLNIVKEQVFYNKTIRN